MQLVIGNQPQKEDPIYARCRQLIYKYRKSSAGLSRSELVTLYQGLIYSNPSDPAADLKEFFKWFGGLMGVVVAIYLSVCSLLIALSQ